MLVSVDEFERLKRSGRRCLAIEELSEAEVTAIVKARVPAEYDHLNASFAG